MQTEFKEGDKVIFKTDAGSPYAASLSFEVVRADKVNVSIKYADGKIDTFRAQDLVHLTPAQIIVGRLVNNEPIDYLEKIAEKDVPFSIETLKRISNLDKNRNSFYETLVKETNAKLKEHDGEGNKD